MFPLWPLGKCKFTCVCGCRLRSALAELDGPAKVETTRLLARAAGATGFVMSSANRCNHGGNAKGTDEQAMTTERRAVIGQGRIEK